MAEEPRFTDRQVREILKRAVEGPHRGGTPARSGLSLTELRAIGAEVGIEPARLEEAVVAVTRGGGRRASGLLGAPLALSYGRTAAGVVPPDATADLLAIIRQSMGKHGEAREVGGSLEWTTEGDLGGRHVTIAPRGDVTAVYGTASLGNAAAGIFVPAGIIGGLISIVGFVASAKDGMAVGMALFPLILPILYLVLRTIFRTVAENTEEKLRSVVDGVADAVEGAAAAEDAPAS